MIDLTVSSAPLAVRPASAHVEAGGGMSGLGTPMNQQHLVETEHRLARADRAWRNEVTRLHGPDGVLLHGYGALGRGEPGSRQRDAFEARRLAVAAWRQARTRAVRAV